jgi:hypothetical protein
MIITKIKKMTWTGWGPIRPKTDDVICEQPLYGVSYFHPKGDKQGNKTPASQQRENKHISHKRLENVTF